MAHPVPRSAHDRVIVVRPMPEALLVEYHLEVDEWTVVFKDLPALFEPHELARFKSPREFYEAFTKSYAPILAGNLVAQLDGQDLEFTCVQHSQKVTDSVQCDFVFRAPWKLAPGRVHQLQFRETNYHLEAGRIDLTLGRGLFLETTDKDEPDEKLRKKAPIELRPGDDARLRRLRVTFTGPEVLPPPREGSNVITELLPPPREGPIAPSETRSHSPLRLFLESQHGFLMLLILSAWIGAVHALTPGHGKTLVAAYLVGERGTAWHAVLLGIVTTLTHTGAVLVLAIGVSIYGEQWLKAVERQLGFIGGLLVAGLGIWLLLRRLSGQADHVHIGGAGHHHHHHHDDHAGADHYHDEHGHAQPLPASKEPLGWGGMVILGIQGGMVPCTEAIMLFGIAVTSGRAWLALPVVLAFSAGLAAVLVAIGIAVVRMKGLAGSRFGETRFFRMLPVLSALIVTVLGLWLCYDNRPLRGAN